MVNVEPANSPQERAALQAEVQNKTAKQIVVEVVQAAQAAQAVKQILDAGVAKREPVQQLVGDKNDPESAKGKATQVRQVVIKVMLAAAGGKTPVPDAAVVGAEVSGLAGTLINQIDAKFTQNSISITEQNAPYIHQLIYRAVNGQITDVQALFDEFKQLFYLQTVDPITYQNLSAVVVDIAAARGMTHAVAEEKIKSGETDIVKATNPYARQGLEFATVSEKEELLTITSQIRAAVEVNMAAQNLPSERDLTPTEQKEIRRFINGGIENQVQATKIMAKLGLPIDRVSRYIELYTKIFPTGDIDQLKGMMTDMELVKYLDQATKEFTIEGLKGKRQIITYVEEVDSKEAGKMVFDRQKFKKMINEFYFLALKEIHSKHSLTYDKAKELYQHGYYFSGLKSVISNLCNSLRTSSMEFAKGDEMDKYLEDVGGRFQSSIEVYAETFHNLPLYARDASTFEKWGSFLGYLFPTELAEVFDPDDPLMEMSRHEISMYLRKRVALNNNKIPPNLFSGSYKQNGVRYGNVDRESMMADLKQRARDMRIAANDWEFQRALTYGLGIGIANLMDPEVICTADPNINTEFRDMYPLAGLLSAKHNWGLGRGYPASGLFPHLLAMDVKLYPEEKGFIHRLFETDHWSPEEFDHFVKGKATEYGGEIFDSLLNRQGKYQELLNMINIGTSLNSRHGWRMQAIREKLVGCLKDGTYDGEKETPYSDATKEAGWGNKEYSKWFDLSMQLYGTASTWWWVGPRVERELKRMLTKDIGYDEMNKEWEEYATGKKGLHKKFTIMVDGEEKKVNFGEYRTMRTNQLRGETFFQYAQRNPGDFVLLLGQIAPELLDLDVDYFDSCENLETKFESEGKSEEEVKKSLAKRQRLVDRWGEPQFARLKEVRNWINITLIKGYQDAGMIGAGKRFADKKAVLNYFLQKSGTAFEKCLQDKVEPLDANGKPIETEDKPARRRKWVKRDDFVGDAVSEPEAEILRKAIFDENGFISLVGRREALGGFDEAHQYDFGEFGFYYKMGELWTLKQGDINPFAADMNHFAVYKHMGESGEEVVKRYLGDAQAVRQMITEVAKLDELLLKMANPNHGGELKELDKLFNTVFLTLKNIISKEAAQKGCYILAQIVGQFFQEHSMRRMPILNMFPFNAAIGAALGDTLSLSKLVSEDRFAKSMDDNALRTFFRHLHDDLHVVELDGMWSVGQLNRAFNAEADRFIVGDAVPNFMTFLALYLLFIYLKKSMGELSGGQKK